MQYLYGSGAALYACVVVLLPLRSLGCCAVWNLRLQAASFKSKLGSC